MEKVLFLDNDLDEFGDFFRRERIKCGVDSQKIFRKRFALLRKGFIFLGLKLFSFFMFFSYGAWKFNISKYDIIIIPSRRSSKFALWMLRKKKVVVYYWNLITDRELNPDYIRKKYPSFVLCTFDPEDAKKYNIRFVDTYYFNLKYDCEKYESDFFYVGGYRPGREDILTTIKELTNNKYIYNFNLIKFDDKNKGIKYADIISMISKTKIIVDLNRNGQNGLTLRPLEALVFKKKLITNNSNIINYPFYNKNNIFILGVDKMEDLDKFYNGVYLDISEELISKYYFENWLKKVLSYE